MNANDPRTRRKILILVSAIDLILAGIVLLIYFGFLPVDLSGWSVPRWVIGVVGGIWFLGALGVLAYQLTKPDIME